MEITKEIAEKMIESGIEELVDIALKCFPDLDAGTEESKVFSILQKKIAKVNAGRSLQLKDKYYPVFHYDKDDVFSFADVGYWCSDLYIPAPICFVDKHDCETFTKENLKLYQKLYEGGCI